MMKEQKGWILGLGLATILGVSGALGYFLGGDGEVTAPGPIETVSIADRTDSPPTIRNTPTDEPISAFEQSDGEASLRYLGMTTSVDDGDPEVCLRFSAALNDEAVIADKAFVRISPETPFSLQTNGRSLCILGLSDAVEQTVTVLPGFTSADGAELSSQIVETVTFDPKPAMVGFVGDGIILPRANDAVLGLKAMNADAVDMTIYRVNHRALFDQTPDVGETTVEGDWSWNSAAYNTRVVIHTETINMSGPVNTMVERGYSLEKTVTDNGPGAYVVEIERAGDGNRNATSWRWLYVTDLAGLLPDIRCARCHCSIHRQCADCRRC